MAMFIEVSVDNAIVAQTPGIAEKIAESCPVKIFKLGSKPSTLDIVEDNVDECTLCDLCLQASKGVTVKKLYE